MRFGWRVVRNLSAAEVTLSLGGLTARVVEAFARSGIVEPRREALRLVAELSGRSVGDLRLRSDDPAEPTLVERVADGARRRASGEPLAYVSGSAGFRDLDLQVDRRVLIPRPETEGLVELVLQATRQGRVVDVGTGSGCIALSLAQEGSYRHVAGVDRSAPALMVARENARRLHLPVSFLQGDLVSALAPESREVVVSNPPYLTEAELQGLDPSVRDWEPHQALASGRDGLNAVRGLLEDARRVLVPTGLLAMEVDSSRAVQVAALARRSGWTDVAVTQDLFGRDRFVTARRESHQ